MRRLNRVFKRLTRKSRERPFPGSEAYWVNRYESGGNSGHGSYNQLAQFKAEVLNQFVDLHDVRSVVEFGCGDGNQLSLAEYPNYLGLDISPVAVDLCRRRFAADRTKSFMLLEEYTGESAELSLSLDVILHLVEDAVFEEYMERLFDAAQRFVGVYSSNFNADIDSRAPHVRHRKFTQWIGEERPDWRQIAHVPNRLPFRGDTRTGSKADFYFFSL